MPRNDLQNLTPPTQEERKTFNKTNRTPRKVLNVGKKFNIDVLNGIINDQADRSEVIVETSTLRSNRDNKVINTIWVGSYPHAPIPYAVVVSNNKGDAKSSSSIFRKGRRFDGTDIHGFARVSIDIGDLITVAVAPSLSPLVVILRVSKFVETEDENKQQAICEVLEVDVFDRSGDQRVYTHDVDGVFLNKVSQEKLQGLIETARRNTISTPKWNGYHLSHLASVPKAGRGLVNYNTVTQVSHVLTPEQLFDELLNSVKNFRIGRKRDHQDGTGLFDHPHQKLFAARTPMRLTYSIVYEQKGELPDNTDKLKGIELQVEIPFADRLLVNITPENFHEFSSEPFLTLYNETFKDLLIRVEQQGHGRDYITEERTLRM